ncbi:MAG: putative rane protein [Rhodospirillales bacterium]|nr:putative rane protein [Rhodospirillales bacterium]
MSGQERSSVGNANWHVIVGGEPRGPLAFTELLALVRGGTLTPEDKVWEPGEPSWRPASEIEGLFVPPPTMAGQALAAKAPGDEVVQDENGSSDFASGPRPHLSGSEVATAAPAVRANYVVRHWRGELPLGVAYWVNGFLGNIATTAIVFAILASTSDSRNLIIPVVALLATWISVVIVIVWQVVGTWRSANRSTRHGWAALAMLMIIGGVVKDGHMLVKQAWPQLADAFQAAIGDPDFGPRGVRTLRDGTELEISGGFARGQADVFRAALANAPKAHVVHLDSFGGRVAEAVQIRDMIIARGMDTFVAKQCQSACIIVFLGGQRRWLAAGAVLGFHSASFGGVDYVNQDFRSAFSAAGVPAWFVTKALGTPSSSIWNPSVSELINAKVVTEVAPDEMFAVSGYGPAPTGETLKKALNSEPDLQAIRKADGSHWSELEDTWVQTGLKGLPISDFSLALRSHMHAASERLRRQAPDDVTLALADLMFRELNVLQKADPELCWQYLRSGGIDLTKYLPQDLVTLEVTVMNQILVEGTKNPTQPPSAELGGRLIEKALLLAVKDGVDLKKLSKNLADDAPHALLCPAYAQVLMSASELPPEEDAAFIRYILTHGF